MKIGHLPPSVLLSLLLSHHIHSNSFCIRIYRATCGHLPVAYYLSAAAQLDPFLPFLKREYYKRYHNEHPYPYAQVFLQDRILEVGLQSQRVYTENMWWRLTNDPLMWLTLPPLVSDRDSVSSAGRYQSFEDFPRRNSCLNL